MKHSLLLTIFTILALLDTSNRLVAVSAPIPEGKEQIEFILVPVFPAPDKRGHQNHICLEVPDIERAKSALEARSTHLLPSYPLKTNIGVDHKRQMNLFDPDGTRVELMEFNTVDGLPAPSSTAPPPK
ncbi:MAG: VOC family protein [Verrucomicrobiae bacterium]